MTSFYTTQVDAQRLTSLDDLPEQILPPEEVPRGAVPPPVPELVLALVDRHVGTLGDRGEHARVLPRKPSLLPPQRRVYRRIHVDHTVRQRRNVVRFAGLRDAPVESTRKKKGKVILASSVKTNFPGFWKQCRYLHCPKIPNSQSKHTLLGDSPESNEKGSESQHRITKMD